MTKQSRPAPSSLAPSSTSLSIWPLFRTKSCAPAVCRSTWRTAFASPAAWDKPGVRGPEAGTISAAALVYDIPMAPLTPEERLALTRSPASQSGTLPRAYINAFMARGEAALGEMPARWRELDTLGVDPPVQGQGYGSALVAAILADAREAGLRVGLLTDRPQNVPFYERAGFVIAWSGFSDDGAVPFGPCAPHEWPAPQIRTCRRFYLGVCGR